MAMASFAAQLKDKFFFLVERVMGYGGSQEEPKLQTVQRVEVIRASQNLIKVKDETDKEPRVSQGSVAGVNAFRPS